MFKNRSFSCLRALYLEDISPEHDVIEKSMQYYVHTVFALVSNGPSNPTFSGCLQRDATVNLSSFELKPKSPQTVCAMCFHLLFASVNIDLQFSAISREMRVGFIISSEKIPIILCFGRGRDGTERERAKEDCYASNRCATCDQQEVT